MAEDLDIVTHPDPVGRDRTNYIVRIDLAQDGLPGAFEQVWTRTEDQRTFELCCIPFFPYRLSLGDHFALTSSEGAYAVLAKSGNRTIRYVLQDQRFAHEQHAAFHRSLVSTGAGLEMRGHALSHGALNCADDDQVAAVLDLLNPLALSGTLLWEWSDPVAD